MRFSFDINDELHFEEGKFLFIAGPCAVEDREQIVSTAKFMKQLGIPVLRGGAFKPRTSPDSFQGLGNQGIELLKQAKEETGIAIVTELMDYEDLDEMLKIADIIQIGSRNSQNFSLLRKVGRLQIPIMLKRGFGNTIDEFLNSAKYITKEGNNKVILAERGIRTFEQSTRFTLDISAVPVIQERVDLPVIVDPSHPAGIARYVSPLAKAGVAVGADGIIVEVHPAPSKALSDSQQQLDFKQFESLYNDVSRMMPPCGREFVSSTKKNRLEQ